MTTGRRQRFAISLAGVMLASVVALVAQSRKVESPENQFKSLEREMLDAYVRRDSTVLSRTYAEDFISIGHNAEVVSKSQVLGALRTSGFKLDSITVTEFRARVYGDAAVTNGRRTYFRGGNVLGVIRSTDVWTKQGGRWLLVSSHHTAVQ